MRSGLRSKDSYVGMPITQEIAFGAFAQSDAERTQILENEQDMAQ